MEGKLEATTAWRLRDVSTAADPPHPLLTSGLLWKTQCRPSHPATEQGTEGMGTMTSSDGDGGGHRRGGRRGIHQRNRGGRGGRDGDRDVQRRGWRRPPAGRTPQRSPAKGRRVGVMETAVSTGGGASPPTRLVRPPWRVWRLPSSVLAVFTVP
jgi:hypothetical protein